MERCETCGCWGEKGSSELEQGRNRRKCNSKQRQRSVRFSTTPGPYKTFGCPCHEPRPAPLTCGGCGFFGMVWRSLFDGPPLHYCTVHKPTRTQRALVPAVRPACEHYKAKAEPTECEEGEKEERLGEICLTCWYKKHTMCSFKGHPYCCYYTRKKPEHL